MRSSKVTNAYFVFVCVDIIDFGSDWYFMLSLIQIPAQTKLYLNFVNDLLLSLDMGT